MYSNKQPIEVWERFFEKHGKLIKSVNYVTGENVLEDDRFSLIEFISEKFPHITQAVTTNGSVAYVLKSDNNKRDIFLECISEVDVSLDYCCANVHNKIRNNDVAFDWAIDTMKDSIIGRDHDGSLNQDYCKWCYADGTYTYSNMDELIDVCVKNMVNENISEEQARSYMKNLLPQLDYWKRYEELSDNGQFDEFRRQLINEINALGIEGMPKVEKLNALVGKYVNLEYTLPNGSKVRFLDDQKTYLGNQLECEFGHERCFGIVADMDFILVCTYDTNGEHDTDSNASSEVNANVYNTVNPELILYKKR